MRAVWACLLFFSMTAFASGLLEKNDPLIEEGMKFYKAGDFANALKKFDGARAQHPNSAIAEFNRGSTLYKLGRYDEAEKAFLRAQQLDDRVLQGNDLYNLGNTMAALGKKEEAIQYFRKALLKNPRHEDARHNLEMMLRKSPPPPQQQPDGGSSDGGADGGADAGADGGTDGGSNGAQDGGTDGGPQSNRNEGADGGSPNQQTPDAGPKKSPDAGPPEEQGTPKSEEEKAQGQDGGAAATDAQLRRLDAGIPKDFSKQNAEDLLNSMRNNEKNLQMWKFQPQKKRRSEKDW